jgi:hypothetical protein
VRQLSAGKEILDLVLELLDDLMGEWGGSFEVFNGEYGIHVVLNVLDVGWE